MAKPIKSLESHYPMIQLVISIISSKQSQFQAKLLQNFVPTNETGRDDYQMGESTINNNFSDCHL